MDLVSAIPTTAAPGVGSAVAIGNFDGVHRGHRAVIGSAVAAAAESGLTATVLTFEPHPRRFFQPDAPPFRLTPLALKVRRLGALGVARVVAAPFDAALAAMSAEEFVARILIDGLRARHVAVGEDFRFGSGRRGDVALLRARGAERGFAVDARAPIGAGAAGAPFSSSAVRAALAQGDVQGAARVLGDWHRIEAVVEQGDQRGRTLGYPTANQGLEGVLTPAYGVYATRAEVLDGPHRGTYDAVSSLGVRPTFDKVAPNFETFLFDFDGDLYGAQLSVSLVAYLRPEVKFDSVETLIAQMDADSAAARAALALAAAGPAPWAD